MPHQLTLRVIHDQSTPSDQPVHVRFAPKAYSDAGAACLVNGAARPRRAIAGEGQVVMLGGEAGIGSQRRVSSFDLLLASDKWRERLAA